MAAGPQMPPAPSPQERRERQAAREARHRQVLEQTVVETMRPTPFEAAIAAGGGSVVDHAIADAVAEVPLKTALQTGTRAERQAAREALRERRQSPHGKQPQRRRPSVAQWLEAMSPHERGTIEESDTFARLSPKARANVVRIRDQVDAALAEAEDAFSYWKATQQENELLEETDDNDETSSSWLDDQEEYTGLTYATEHAYDEETEADDYEGDDDAA